MYLKWIVLRNFRNFSDRKFDFAEGINLITGDNGVGKTNLLEAIAYLSLPRSFRRVRDRELVKWGENFFRIEGSLNTGLLDEKRVVFFSDKKELLIDGKKVENMADYLRGFIVLSFVPENQRIVDGAPQERRSALDRLIATLDSLYFRKLVSLRKAIKQKNTLLKSEAPESAILPWNRKIEEESKYIVEKRREYIEKLNRRLPSIYKEFTGLDARLIYSPSFDPDTDTLDIHLKREMEKQLSLFGPHLDRIEFSVNDRHPKVCLSEGEKRMLLFAFYLAERETMREEMGIDPVFVMDEPLSILGKRFSLSLLSQFKGQTFITSVQEIKGVDYSVIKLWRE